MKRNFVTFKKLKELVFSPSAFICANCGDTYRSSLHVKVCEEKHRRDAIRQTERAMKEFIEYKKEKKMIKEQEYNAQAPCDKVILRGSTWEIDDKIFGVFPGGEAVIHLNIPGEYVVMKKVEKRRMADLQKGDVITTFGDKNLYKTVIGINVLGDPYVCLTVGGKMVVVLKQVVATIARMDENGLLHKIWQHEDLSKEKDFIDR